MPRVAGLVVVVAVVVAQPACNSREPGSTPGSAPAKGARLMLTPQRTVIGSVKMREDGTLVLDLRHPWMHREIPPGHPEHDGIVAHVGGLSPGQEKPVPPWPDDIHDDAVEASLRAYFSSKGIPPDECSATIEGKDGHGRVLVSVVRGAQHWSLRLHAGSYQVLEAE